MRRFCFTGIVLFFWLSLGWGEIKKGNDIVGFNIGLGIPLSNEHFGDIAGTGKAFGADLVRLLTDHVGLGLGLDYIIFGKKRVVDTLGASHEIEVKSFAINALGRYNILADKKWIPFVLIGAGVNYAEMDKTDPGPLTGSNQITPSGFLSNDAFLTLTLSIGGGVELSLGKTFGLGFQARYHHIELDANRFAGTDNARAITLLGRLRWASRETN